MYLFVVPQGSIFLTILYGCQCFRSKDGTRVSTNAFAATIFGLISLVRPTSRRQLGCNSLETVTPVDSLSFSCTGRLIACLFYRLHCSTPNELQLTLQKERGGVGRWWLTYFSSSMTDALLLPPLLLLHGRHCKVLGVLMAVLFFALHRGGILLPRCLKRKR